MKENFSSLKMKLAVIDEQFNDCPDLIRRKVYLKGGREGYFIYFDRLAENQLLQPEFLGRILAMEAREFSKEETVLNLPLFKIRLCRDSDTLASAILSGEIIFIIDLLEYAIAFSPKESEYVESGQSDEERSIYSLNESFGNQLQTNIALLRRKFRSNRLKFKVLDLDPITKEKVAIAYLDGTTACQYLNTFYHKIRADSGKGAVTIPIEQVLKDSPYSPFPQYQSTKSLDLAVSAILEGRLVIIKDSNPVAILTPVSLFTFFQAPGDKHIHPLLVSVLRLIRIAIVLAIVFLPGLYIAVTSFHYQFLPADFLVTLAESRLKVPFLPVIEVLFMEIILTIFYELSNRFSAPIGLWVVIGGGLFLIGALLTTGLISGFLLIISALAFMASFLISIYHIATIRLLRLMFILFAAVFGMLGVAISASLIFSHLIVLKSLDLPYLRPFTFKKTPVEP